MKLWYKDLIESLHWISDDLKYLLFVGLPGGILMILLHECMDYSNLF